MSRKKEEVLQTGRRLFLQFGIIETSMEQIAEAVPVSKMTIYNYFQSKEGLLDQIVDRIVDEMIKEYRDIVDHARNPLDALGRLANERGRFSAYVTDKFVTDLVKFPDQMEKLIRFNQEHVVPEFEMLIFKGQQMGQIRKDISPQVLVAFLTFIKEFSARTEWYKGLGSLNAISEQLSTILYYGIIQRDESEPKQ